MSMHREQHNLYSDKQEGSLNMTFYHTVVIIKGIKKLKDRQATAFNIHVWSMKQNDT